MNQQDIDFFEAYKHLDKLCGEIFNCNNGVSKYILEMENLSGAQYKVASWSSDYKSLKHIRWVRNRIAHDSADFALSDENDLYFAELFYDRIMNQEDPLAKLRITESKLKQRAVHQNIYDSVKYPFYDIDYQESDLSKKIGKCVLGCFGVSAGILFLIAILIYAICC